MHQEYANTLDNELNVFCNDIKSINFGRFLLERSKRFTDLSLKLSIDDIVKSAESLYE